MRNALDLKFIAPTTLLQRHTNKTNKCGV